MENITMYTMKQLCWHEPALSAPACATDALRPFAVQGLAVRPAAVDGRFAPFAAAGVRVTRDGATLVATDAPAVKRERIHAQGLPAWSPPI